MSESFIYTLDQTRYTFDGYIPIATINICPIRFKDCSYGLCNHNTAFETTLDFKKRVTRNFLCNYCILLDLQLFASSLVRVKFIEWCLSSNYWTPIDVLEYLG